jgi:hypothetical protein
MSLFKILLFTFTSCVFYSCNQNVETDRFSEGSYKYFPTMLNNCKGTTRVIAISEMEGSFDYCKISIVVIDENDSVYSCRIGGDLGLKIGDTLK